MDGTATALGVVLCARCSSTQSGASGAAAWKSGAAGLSGAAGGSGDASPRRSLIQSGRDVCISDRCGGSGATGASARGGRWFTQSGIAGGCGGAKVGLGRVGCDSAMLLGAGGVAGVPGAAGACGVEAVTAGGCAVVPIRTTGGAAGGAGGSGGVGAIVPCPSCSRRCCTHSGSCALLVWNCTQAGSDASDGGIGASAASVVALQRVLIKAAPSRWGRVMLLSWSRFALWSEGRRAAGLKPAANRCAANESCAEFTTTSSVVRIPRRFGLRVAASVFLPTLGSCNLPGHTPRTAAFADLQARSARDPPDNE
jgi:hypothetical protein